MVTPSDSELERALDLTGLESCGEGQAGMSGCSLPSEIR